MKLTHFLVLAVIVGGLGIFGLTKACKKDSSDDVPPPTTATTTTSTPPAPTPAISTTTTTTTTPTEPASTSDLAARPYDQEVIAWSKRSISGDKMKDATKGKPYKVNLYKDAGMTTVNRAKVDIDRDDKFDEKYTFETTKITLERAPNDDEQYSETYHWNGNGWTKAGAAPASGTTSTPATPTPTAPTSQTDLPAREYDQEVIAWSKRAISGDKMKDATKGKSYKVNLYMDAGNSTVNRAKVDTDRDDKFDEKYTFETTKITLQRAPNDDEQYTETYHWNGSGWTKE